MTLHHPLLLFFLFSFILFSKLFHFGHSMSEVKKENMDDDESESEEIIGSETETEDNLVIGHNPIGGGIQQNRVIGEQSAERILIKVLRQSGFQTEEEINEVVTSCRMMWIERIVQTDNDIEQITTFSRLLQF